MRTSVVVSAFRRPDLVPHVLRRLAAQVVRPDQIIYAEDDLAPAMEEAIRTSAARLHLPVLLVRQPNRGARKTVAVNRAVRHATGDRLLFLDQDCLPGRLWLATHRLLADRGNLVQGWRVHVAQTEVPRFLSERFPVVRALLRGKVYARHRLLPRLQRFPTTPAGFEILGCNLSVNRADFLAVGGYDETFVDWAYEDVDLVIRLCNFGRRYRLAAGPLAVFHLDHSVQPRAGANTRMELCRRRRQDGTVRAAIGLDRPAPVPRIRPLDPTCTLVEHDD